MTKNKFKEFLDGHSRLKMTEFEWLRVKELLNALENELLERLAFSISLDRDKKLRLTPLNLSVFMDFVRDELVLKVEDLARKTELMNAPKEMTNYEKNRYLVALYWKKEMAKLPEWAKTMPYADEPKKRKNDE